MSDRCAHSLRCLGYHVADYNGCPFLRQAAGGSRADALPTAGNNHDLAFKPTGAGRFGVEHLRHHESAGECGRSSPPLRRRAFSASSWLIRNCNCAMMPD